MPAGFNKFQWPALKNSFYSEGIPFGQVLVAAVPIALLTYLESVSVGRKYALVHKYALDMTQELWALGFGCLFASFFQAYPPGGSFSRTALKHEVRVVGDGCWTSQGGPRGSPPTSTHICLNRSGSRRPSPTSSPRSS